MNSFYIYIYLDPRKSGQYCYGDFCFLFEPIYVGKGKNERWKDIYHRTKYFKNILNKIKNSGLEHIVFKLYENLNEGQSFEKEIELIEEIGRKNIKTGFLVNETIGGDGCSGCKRNKESIKLSSEKRRKNFQEIKNEFENREYILLTTEIEYKNAHQKLKYICSKGHNGSIRWNDFQQGQGCYICKYESHSKNQRKNFDEIKKEFENRGYKLLTKEEEYKNNKQKLDYICPKGHNGLIDWSHFHRGQGCSNNICLIKNKL